MPIIVTTSPTLKALTKTEVKEFLRLEEAETVEDSLLDSLIDVATELAEDYFNRTLLTTGYTLTIERFKEFIRLPKAPTQSVTSISYKDEDNASQSFTSFTTNVSAEPGFIHIASNIDYPTVYEYEPYPIIIVYTAGWTQADDVPARIKLWMKNLIAAYYEQRNPNSIVNVKEIKGFMSKLAGNERVLRFS